MRGNSLGKLFSVTTFGESHGVAIGAVVDGVPPNIVVDIEELSKFLGRRSPGKEGTSKRKESDTPEILSGVFNGKTLGTPICVIVKNQDVKSEDYEALKNVHRFGHADKTTEIKYGIRDYRGGGRASGRETVARVIGGFFALKILEQIKGFKIETEVERVANYSGKLDLDSIRKYLEELHTRGDSAGGLLKVTIKNPPKGLGEPCFDKLKADLGKAILSIGGCFSFSIGDGENFSRCLGSDYDNDNSIFGGIEGGISSGDDIIFRAAFKPTPSVKDIAKKGRHDPSIFLRAIAVVESMSLIVLADHYLRQRAYEEK